jgi:hypothetical protein
VSILYLYSYLKDNPHLSYFTNNKKDMGCVIPHQTNAVNIPHHTNAGLINGIFVEQYKALYMHNIMTMNARLNSKNYFIYDCADTPPDRTQ